jgi:hypothetical protein
MKKIYLRESSLNMLNKQRLLPKFLFKMVKNHNTSLGNSEVFPSGDGYPFDYIVLKKRYNEVCDEIEKFNFESLEEDFLITRLSKLIKECKEMEKPIRNELERVCENAVNRLFAIPKDILAFNCKLRDKIIFKKSVRVTPESNEGFKYTFKDLDDINHSNKVIEKRRFINSLIQGASYIYSKNEELYKDEIIALNGDLIPLYREIIAINDYLLFTKKESLTDENPMQGSYVEVHLGQSENRTLIDSQGIIFPLLLQETIRGLFELFSSHGLPNDMDKAKYVIRKADYLLAEPWDLRLGVGLWEKIFGKISDTNIIPYVFKLYVQLPTDDFNLLTKEIFYETEKGKEEFNELVDTATYDSGYEAFTNRINAKNVNKAVINDNYFTAAELDSFDLDGDENEQNDVIEEDGENGDAEIYNIDYQTLLFNSDENNISFLNGGVNAHKGNCYSAVVVVNNVEIPTQLVNIELQIVPIRISETNTLRLPQIHIILDESIRGHGVGTKLYKALINQFGGIYSSGGRRVNDESISAIYNKLSREPNIDVYWIDNDEVKDRNGNNTKDYIAIKNG